MSRSTRYFLVVALALSCCPGWIAAAGPVWSEEQMQVWTTLEKISELIEAKDLEAAKAYFHEDFSGWGTDSPLPVDKNARWDSIAHSRSTSEPVFRRMTPVDIRVNGGVAVVHSYMTGLSRDLQTGHEELRHIRWTDVLLRQGDRWLLIADHGRLWEENCRRTR